MREHDLKQLRDRLLQSGVTPRHVGRAISELRDHCGDLEAEALARGLSPVAAQADAMHRIGDLDVIARGFESATNLKLWVFRYPRAARFILPAAYYLMLPAIPLHAGLNNAPVIARWGAALLLSALVTAGMLLAMQLSIAI